MGKGTMNHRFGITSTREKWRGIESIRETMDGYDWAPFRYIYRVYRWRDMIIWKQLLAKRQMDQYELIKWAFR